MYDIAAALKKQIDTNRSKNILYSDFEHVFEISPEFLTLIQQMMTENTGNLHQIELDDHISIAVKALLSRLYLINQYLYISHEKINELRNIYSKTWNHIMTSRKIQETLRDYHYPHLSQWLSGLYPDSFLDALQSRAYVGNVVCREYSAAFQIDCLNIDVDSLKQPLLDIGCGKQAILVRYLNSLGIEAYGIDRTIEQTATRLRQSDWFDFQFRSGSWGTILSNMAFSNHFLYTHHHNSSQLGTYFTLFNEICTSLKPGGSFYYAPNLPFVEKMTDNSRYRMEKSLVFQNIGRTRITRLAR